MWRAISGFIYGFLGLLSAAVTLWLFFNDTWGFLSGDGRIAVIILAALVAWFMAENSYVRGRLTRRAKFADAVPIISAGFADIHAYQRIREPTVSGAILAGERLCNAVARAFTLITGTRCCVSVKLLFEENHPETGRTLRVQTFCRNDYQRPSGKPNNIKHLLTENSDFLEIFRNFGSPKGTFFFSNRLPFLFDYRNSSFQIYGQPQGGLFARYWRWSLPYRSTMVVPICPSHATDKSELIGFLCVDSTQVGAFQAGTDIELLSGVADGVYNFFRHISELELVNEGKKAESQYYSNACS